MIKLETYCQERGLRLSVKRQIVGKRLAEQLSPVDAESLWLTILSDGTRISRASVYTSLYWFCKIGWAGREVSGQRKYLFSVQEYF